MGSDVRVQPLTPLERLQLRDALQDRWREQVRQITVLSVARYEREDVALSTGLASDGSSLARSINRARARLEDLEQAMRRLDDRSYGHCLGCGEPIGVARLTQTPEETSCESCARGDVALRDPSTDVGVA